MRLIKAKLEKKAYEVKAGEGAATCAQGKTVKNTTEHVVVEAVSEQHTGRAWATSVEPSGYITPARGTASTHGDAVQGVVPRLLASLLLRVSVLDRST